MKEGKIYKNKETQEIFLLVCYNPIFSEVIILHSPTKRVHTGQVEFYGMFGIKGNNSHFEEFKGTLLITCI